jgi:hypothetical protein
VLGIIREDGKPCSTYFPSSFSSLKNELDFMPDVTLGPELMVNVDSIAAGVAKPHTNSI